MSLDSVVNLQITVTSTSLTLPGFGTIMLPVVTSNFAERLRYYTSVAGMLADGFITSDAVVRMAGVIFGQNPRPSRIAVGRRAAAVAGVDRVHIGATADGTYSITVDGQTASFVASSSTAAQIQAGLVSAVNALTPELGRSNVTATTSSTTEVILTTDTSGVPVSYVLASPSAGGLTFSQNVLINGNAVGIYQVIIGSKAYAYAADGVTTASAICDAIIALITADTAAVVSAVAGAGDSIDIRSTTRFVVTTATSGSSMTKSQRTLAVGYAEDLAAIIAEQPDFYAVGLVERDAVSILTAAAAVEPMRRILLVQSNDAEILSLPYNSATPNADIFSLLHARGYARTVPVYAGSDTNDVAVAWAGKQLPDVPGSSTWCFKQLRGVVVDTLSETQQTNLKSKSGNFFGYVAGRNIMSEGTVADGEFIDVIHGVDDLFSQIQAEIFRIKLRTKKVPYTDRGIGQLGAGVRKPLLAKTRDGLIAESRTNDLTGDLEMPAFTITLPKASEISSSDRETRVIPASNPITFEGTLAGAIHATNIRGTLSA